MSGLQFHRLHMPTIISGRGSLSFIASLGKKRIAVLGYDESVKKRLNDILSGTDAVFRYIATISREPHISDIYDNLPEVAGFRPDMILAVGGGSVMDVAKAIHLFYENPELSFEDALRPFQLPELGRCAIQVAVPTTSGTGSESSSAAVFIDPETNTKKLMLANTLIPHYAVLDAELTDSLPRSVRIATGLDALCHAVESATAKNACALTKSLAFEAALDILEYLPVSADASAAEDARQIAGEKLHIAAGLAGIAITNSCTGIVHSYDHPGPAFGLPHGIVCGMMLPYAMQLLGPQPEYACIAKRLGYSGNDAELSEALIRHLQALNQTLGLSNTFSELGIEETAYFRLVPNWAEISLPAFATQMSPVTMNREKGEAFYRLCYYGK